VSDPLGHTTSFASTYPNFRVKTADSAADNIQYTLSSISGDPCIPGSGPDAKVTNATINGRSTNYAYSHTPTTETVVSTAPLSQTYTYASAANAGVNLSLCRSGVRTMTDPLGRQTTFNFDGYIRMTDATQPEGNSTHQVIDGVTPPASDNRGNVTQRTANPKPGSGSPPLSESYTFPACSAGNQKICNQPAAYSDPRGNVTTYTYDANHGGVLTETDPPDSNGIQPVKRYAYAQRYAWILNASGSYVQAPAPIWLRTEERTCAQTATVGSACAGGSSDEIITSYDYGPDSGPNNLLLRGKVVTASGTSLRTCYGYDKYGNKVSETSPRAGLTSCP
jgi:YD repeat-containing protein